MEGGAELLADLPEPEGTPVGVGPAARLAELPDSIDDHLDDVADITAALDRLPFRSPPAVDDGLAIDLW